MEAERGNRALLLKYLILFYITLLAKKASSLEVNHTVLDADVETKVLLRYRTFLDGHIFYREGVLNGYAFQ